MSSGIRHCRKRIESRSRPGAAARTGCCRAPRRRDARPSRRAQLSAGGRRVTSAAAAPAPAPAQARLPARRRAPRRRTRAAAPAASVWISVHQRAIAGIFGARPRRAATGSHRLRESAGARGIRARAVLRGDGTAAAGEQLPHRDGEALRDADAAVLLADTTSSTASAIATPGRTPASKRAAPPPTPGRTASPRTGTSA